MDHKMILPQKINNVPNFLKNRGTLVIVCHFSTKGHQFYSFYNFLSVYVETEV